MLIIEGADDLGKTTAAKRIVELIGSRLSNSWSKLSGACNADDLKADFRAQCFPIRYQHMTRPNSAFNFLDDYTDMMSKYAVQDRFHLGGLVWHDGEITPPALRIIEGRLLALGSLIIIFYASDNAWYRDLLVNNSSLLGGELQKKQQMFDVPKMMTGNGKYRTMVEHRTVHFDHIHDVSRQGFPNDDQLMYWYEKWEERLRLVGR